MDPCSSSLSGTRIGPQDLALVDVSRGVDVAAQQIMKEQKHNFGDVLAQMRIMPAHKSRMKIPLCRLISTPIVRPALKSDVKKLESNFLHSYR